MTAFLPVHLNTEFTVDMFKEGGFDVVIMALGLKPVANITEELKAAGAEVITVGRR